LSIYRKPAHTDVTIEFSSNHPYNHKMAAFNYYITRMLTLPITEQAKQQEWKIMLTTAQNNGFLEHITHNLKKKLISKKERQKPPTTQQNKIWVTFTCYSPLIRKFTNIFKQTNLNIAFQDTNTIYQQLTDKPTNTNPSGIYQLKCNTCNNAYIGQSSNQ